MRRDFDYERDPTRHEQGDFRFQAGPVSLKTGGRCIFARGAVKWKGTTHWVVTSGTTDGEKDQRAAFCK